MKYDDEQIINEQQTAKILEAYGELCGVKTFNNADLESQKADFVECCVKINEILYDIKRQISNKYVLELDKRFINYVKTCGIEVNSLSVKGQSTNKNIFQLKMDMIKYFVKIFAITKPIYMAKALAFDKMEEIIEMIGIATNI